MMTSRRFLFLVLALLIGCAVGDSPLHKVNEEEISQRRELWSFWDLLNLVGLPVKPPCPPNQGGPAAHGNCRPPPVPAPTSSSSGTNAPTASPSSAASSSSAASAETTNSNVSQESSMPSRSRVASWWWLLAVAMASVAIGAAIWGRKKMRERHILDGSVKRRMGLFSRWADAALCGAAAGGTDHAVEMTAATEEKKYERMA